MRLKILLPILALAILNAGCARQEPGVSAAELTEMKEQLAAAQRLAQRADDWTQIANLQSIVRLLRRQDRAGTMPRTCSAPDATLEIAGRGLFAGQDRIREYLHAARQVRVRHGCTTTCSCSRLSTSPTDGSSAKARWRSFMQVGHLGKEARWGEATYENEYVKEGGTWKISKLHSFITFYVEFDKGWNKGGVELPKHLEWPGARMRADGEIRRVPGCIRAALPLQESGLGESSSHESAPDRSRRCSA